MRILNPDGGHYYHADANCPSVKADYLPLSAFENSLLSSEYFSAMAPCPICLSDTAEIPEYVPQTAPVKDPDDITATDDVTIAAQEAAIAFAKGFFVSPHVDENLEGRELTASQVENVWQVTTAAEQQPALTLLFSATGRIWQYTNSTCQLPSLNTFMFEPRMEFAQLNQIDEIRLSLFQEVENDQTSVYARVESSGMVFYALDDLSAWIALDENSKLVGFGDFDGNETCYNAYLTRKQAVQAAYAALAQSDAPVLVQARFVVTEDASREADAPSPTWKIALGENVNGSGETVVVVVDATTGDTIQPEEEYGNG